MRLNSATHVLATLLVLPFATSSGGCVTSAVDGAAATIAGGQASGNARSTAAQPTEQPAGAGTGQMANRLVVARQPFERVEVVMRKSMPPQFDLLLTKQMPTPGYALEVEDLQVDSASGRIIAEVSEHKPQGMQAQVMTDTTCRVELGAIEPGSWILELWMATADGRLAPVHAMVLDAR